MKSTRANINDHSKMYWNETIEWNYHKKVYGIKVWNACITLLNDFYENQCGIPITLIKIWNSNSLIGFLRCNVNLDSYDFYNNQYCK